MTERKPQGMSFETWVEQQIRQASDEGAFEGLALTGKPLPPRAREKSSYEGGLGGARPHRQAAAPPGPGEEQLRVGAGVGPPRGGRRRGDAAHRPGAAQGT